jgi:hypothetical protein
MYSLIKTLGLKKSLIREVPSLGLSLVIAEEAYKFGSFLLECGAFLTTWYLISMVADLCSRIRVRS